jgi:hypothetical protein
MLRNKAGVQTLRAPLIGTVLVTPIAIAQKTVSFHTDDGGVIFADLYSAGERFVPAFAG